MRGVDETRTITEGGRQFREPVMSADDMWGMIRALYSAGWSYRLIAQFCGMSSEAVGDALVSNGASVGAADMAPASR